MPAERAILACGLLMLAGPAIAQNVLHPDGPYIQKPSGMTFPAAVGGFKRVEVVRYIATGVDESARYDDAAPGRQITAEVYVFPVPGYPNVPSLERRPALCQSVFEVVQREVKKAHPEAVLVKDGPAALRQQGNNHSGFQAVYDLTSADFFGRAQAAVRSEAYLFCFPGGKWTVEYRFNHARDVDAGPAIAAFMRDLAWTIPPEGGI